MPIAVNESQFGFRPGRSCSDAIHVIRCLQKWVDEADMAECHLVLYDLRKYYDTIPREAMWSVLRKAGVPNQVVNLIRLLHDGARASVKVDGINSPSFPVAGGLRQGCTLAPALSIIYMAAVMSIWRNRVECDFRVDFDLDSLNLKRPVASRRKTGTTTVADVAFVDDVGSASLSFENARHQAEELDRTVNDFGLQIAWSKTKILSMGSPMQSLELNDHAGRAVAVEAVSDFRYLGPR
eukprot:gene826-93_t